MKLSPLFIFILLLFIFLISILVYHCFRNKEGFISYEQDKEPLSNILIPPYSTTKPVLKIYDNLFLDQTNFNLIEINGTAYNNGETVTGNIDNTINNVIVVSPCTSSSCTGKSISGTNTTDFSLSSLKLPILTAPWSYVSQTTATDTYQIFFIPIPSINTVISYVANLSPMKSLMALKVQTQVEYSYFVSDPSFKGLNSSIENDNNNGNNNGNMVVEPFYDPNQQVYQITTLVKFDYSTQNLLVKSSDGNTLSIYDNSKNKKLSTSNVSAGTYANSNTTNTTNTFSCWTIVDENNNLIVYIPVDSEYTLVLILLVDSNKLSLYKSATFQKKVGLKLINGITPTPAITPAPTTAVPTPTYAEPTPSITTSKPGNYDGSNSTTPPTKTKKNPISSYYNEKRQKYKDDYILKTQLIPPVSCPNCICSGSSCSTETPANKCCNSCGGSTNGVSVNTPAPATATPTPIVTLPPLVLPNNIFNPMSSLSSNNVDSSGNLLNRLIGDVENTGSALLSGAEKIGNGLYNGVDKVGNGLYNGVEKVGGGVYNGVDKVGNGLYNGVDKVGNGLYNGVDKVGNGLYNGVEKVGGGVYNGASTLGNGLYNGASTLGNGLYNGTSTLGNGTNLGTNNEPVINGIGLSGRIQPSNQRNQYYGNPQQPANLMTQYGAQSGQTSTYIPITSDFSRFAK
jgi:hypothetical protein